MMIITNRISIDILDDLNIINLICYWWGVVGISFFYKRHLYVYYLNYNLVVMGLWLDLLL